MKNECKDCTAKEACNEIFGKDKDEHCTISSSLIQSFSNKAKQEIQQKVREAILNGFRGRAMGIDIESLSEPVKAEIREKIKKHDNKETGKDFEQMKKELEGLSIRDKIDIVAMSLDTLIKQKDEHRDTICGGIVEVLNLINRNGERLEAIEARLGINNGQGKN